MSYHIPKMGKHQVLFKIHKNSKIVQKIIEILQKIGLSLLVRHICQDVSYHSLINFLIIKYNIKLIKIKYSESVTTFS